METFFQALYNNGFKDGFQDGSKASQNIDFKTELVQLLDGIKGKGIGEKTKKIIMDCYREKGEVEDES